MWFDWLHRSAFTPLKWDELIGDSCLPAMSEKREEVTCNGTRKQKRKTNLKNENTMKIDSNFLLVRKSDSLDAKWLDSLDLRQDFNICIRIPKCLNVMLAWTEQKDPIGSVLFFPFYSSSFPSSTCKWWWWRLSHCLVFSFLLNAFLPSSSLISLLTPSLFFLRLYSRSPSSI